MTDREPPDFSMLRVMIVDDEEMVRTLLETMLRRMGIEHIIGLATAQSALETAETSAIDIAIVDWQLDDMDGGDLISALRQVTGRKPESFGIFLLTGFPLADRVLAANRAGANEFLVKPIQSETLHRHIAHFMRQRRIVTHRTESRISNWHGVRP